MNALLKIAITGPECSGKTSLCMALANHHQTGCVPEFARYYLEDLQSPYQYSDLLCIAQGQQRMEKICEPLARKFLFCDTNADVIKVWSMHRFRECHPWVEQQVAHQDYAGYILTRPDIEWMPDPLREHPAARDRKYFFNCYRKILEDRGKPFCIVSGHAARRLKDANRFLARWQ